MTALVKLNNLVSGPIEQGDCGVVIRPDGTFRIFSCTDIQNNQLTEAQTQQATTLMALLIPLQHPDIMAALVDMLADPSRVGDKVVDLGTLN